MPHIIQDSRPQSRATRTWCRLIGPSGPSGLVIFVMVVVLALPGVTAAQDEDGAWPTIATKTEGMERLDGYFPLYWDDRAGTLWLEIERLGTEVLYINGLAAGVGSNDIGLDRGQIGDARIVSFDRVGSKILMVQPNYRYRATTDNPDERRAVDDAFATSVLFGFTVAARTGDRFLVEATEFVLRDAHGAADRLPGRYRLDTSRSAVYLPRTKGFPKNTEMEATLTFAREQSGDGPGFGRGSIAAVTPSADAVTIRQHHSLVELPDDNYTPRPYDPRAGYGAVTYVDYAAPLGEPMTRRYLRRHRLEKVDPTAEVSEAVDPIVYYLDRGTPEPVRSALLEGARWWNQAFEAAGYRDAFRVELMPEGADSLDVRYNVIQWVHRSTRGWSYGNSVTDPRTGEIIKGHVTLGSLRVRQDYLIAEGLLSPYFEGDETPRELSEMALARIRQLSAHEVGHTIGLGHNYYASEQDRVSVMDYPHPLVALGPDAQIDLSNAYAVGIGAWDKVAITYGYQDFSAGADTTRALETMLDDAWAEDLRYLTGQDTDAHPRVHIWANGTDPAQELRRMMQVRRVSLDRFGETAIRNGAPMATLEEALVPLYLHHRYQVDAAVSALGGSEFVYAMRGDGRVPVSPVPADGQRAVLSALIEALRPAELALPTELLGLIAPRPAGYPMHRELFPRHTGSIFDALSPAIVLADLTVARVLDSARAARVVEQHAVDSGQLGLAEMLDTLIDGVINAPTATTYEAEVARAVERVVVDRMIGLADGASLAQVRSEATSALRALGERAERGGSSGPAMTAHRQLIAADIERFLARPGPASPSGAFPAPTAPPGSPIGDPAMSWLRTSETVCEWELYPGW